MKELVSIITPLYNSKKFIADTLESVINQSYTNWEMLIVDDCSTDNGAKIVKKYSQNDNRIKYFKQNINKGPAKTRNKAIKLANGRYIAFLDSDDLWKKNKLKKQLEYMKNNDFAFTFTRYQKINENGEKKGHISVPKKVNYKELLKHNVIGCLTAMYDIRAIGKVYMPDILRRQDYGLWLRILKKVKYAYGLDENLAYYRVRKNTVSSNKIKAAQYQWKIYRSVENLNLLKSMYYFSHYAIKGIIKYLK
ncbi:MAG: glycosyltransferase family 2 protein [Kosmotoga sp.]|nr:MAG: glycosyltransferase family 2 protein [Kosmotoga sp.]